MARPKHHGFWEFFAGAGMARLGLGEAWSCRWANDIDESKAAVYRSWFADGVDHLLVDDVANVYADDLPGTDTRMAWASFPCQDLSLAGWGRGMGARRSGTFWAFWRLMHDLRETGRRPPLIVLENVVGLLRPAEFGGLAEALADLGMRFGALVVDAVRFLPQSRPRVFVVAVDESIDTAPWTTAEPQMFWASRALLRTHDSLDQQLKRRWVWWRLPAPPPVEDRPRLEDLLEPDPPDAQWHDKQGTAHLIQLMTTLHRDRLVDPPTPVGTLYRRTREGRQRAEVRFDGIAGCLRTPQGGSSRQTVVDVRSGTPRTRLLTARETARLMGVPNDLPLPEHYNQAYKAMGDGVAVPAVKHLANHLLTPLADAIASNYSLVVDAAERLAGQTPIAVDLTSSRSAQRAADWAALADVDR
jgi:DNA (cytosine-5)-methyltransferase 1